MKNLEADILVIGSGLAGSLFALELAKERPDLQIMLLSKKDKSQSASFYAQGGIAASLPGAVDSWEQHLEDTLEASAYSSNKAVAAYFVSRAAKAICTLEYWGTSFDLRQDGSRALALEGGHKAHRVLHHKDSTGKHIIEKLHASLPLFPNIKVLEDVQVLELLKSPETGAVAGAVAWDSSTETTIYFRSKGVVLATGGLGSLYAHSTNPGTANGEGIYLASRARAEIINLSYVQFHPTALWQPTGTQLSLISEAVRGAGAILRNEQGQRFMESMHPQKELAPRDIVSRCISSEILKQHKPYVYLDATVLGSRKWENHFPGILASCKKTGIDPLREWIPVVPAAHYSCGGIATSVKGETSIDMLFAIGETACTGLHGANRLASNSLLEATIMASALAAFLAKMDLPHFNSFSAVEFNVQNAKMEEERAASYLQEIRMLMQMGCGIVKSTFELKAALRQLLILKEKLELSLPSQSLQYIKIKMALETAILLCRDCLEQKENVGVFYNRDLEKSEVQEAIIK